MRMFFRYAHAALTTMLFASLVATGCGTASKTGAPIVEQAVAVQKPSPVKVAFLQDKTGSTTWTRTPQLTAEHLDLLIEVLRRAGGELGFGLIRNDSNRSLVRLRIEPPPEPVAKPMKTGRLFSDARRMEQYRNDMIQFQQKLAAWQAETNQHIARFKKDV